MIITTALLCISVLVLAMASAKTSQQLTRLTRDVRELDRHIRRSERKIVRDVVDL